jgi:NHLM bacteriocin system ABC transporter peptidase/ATP-binding protein
MNGTGLKKRRVKTPNYLQVEAVECGAACLAMVLGYFGRYVPLVELREACGVSRDGSKASYILKAALNYGLEGQGYSVSVEQLMEKPLPIIIFWEFNHFVVVEGFKDNTVYLNDPAMGYRTVTLEEFRQSFTGVALTFQPGPTFKKGGQKPNFFPALLRRLQGKTTSLIFLTLTGLLLIIPGLLLPLLSKIFVDDFLVKHLNGWLAPLLFSIVLATVLQGSLTWLQQYYLLRFRMQLSLSTSAQYFWHVLRLPLTFYSQRSAGDITQRYGLCDQAAELISIDLIATVLSLLTVIFYLVLMFFYSVSLTLLGLTITLINVFMLYLFGRAQINYGQRVSRDMGVLYAMSMNGLRLIETYKASGLEASFFSRIIGQVTKVMNAYLYGIKTNLKILACSHLLPGLNTVVVLGVGGYLVINGVMTIGMLVAFQLLLASFMLPFTQLIMMINQFQQIHGDMNRLDDVMSSSEDKNAFATHQNHTGKRKPHIPLKLNGELVIRDLMFGYSHVAKPLLEGIHLTIKPGMFVGLVGSSTSGRSTLARIIAGLYQPWSGEILLDNQLYQQIDPSLFHRSVALANQNMNLFEGTLRDNLTLWNHAISESTLIQAAKDACIHALIVDRESGYDAWVEENARNFSGGEQQRIELARALATDPSLLILDDALSALDEPVEKQVLNNLRLRGLSCLLITHRLNTIKQCDQILVLDKGRIIQQGTHDALLAEGGLYRDLIHANQ